jgi:hypothetical protein
MKRFAIVLMALLIVAGTAGMAAAALTFDVDFWTSAADKLGPGDLGKTIDIVPGNSINIDIYFSTDLQLVAASWDLKFSPSSLASILGSTAPGAPWVLPVFTSTPGSLTFEAAVFPGSTVTGNNVFFGTILLQCEGVGDVDLTLANYLGFLTLADIVNFDPVKLGTLNQVPIPGAVWLLGAGLAGLVGIRRKMRK